MTQAQQELQLLAMVLLQQLLERLQQQSQAQPQELHLGYLLAQERCQFRKLWQVPRQLELQHPRQQRFQ
jgi:hypothetical protein